LPEEPRDEDEGTDEDEDGVDSGEEEEQDGDEYDEDDDGLDVEADEDGMGFKIRIPARVDDDVLILGLVLHGVGKALVTQWVSSSSACAFKSALL
jgi:hypothetical protein